MNWRTAGVVTTIMVLGLGTAACGGQNSISEANVTVVRQALATAVSGATGVVLDPIGDGFTQPYRLSLRFTSAAVTAPDARAAARRAARVVWDTADTQWTTLWVETGCASATVCSGVHLTVDAASAEVVWGAPARGDHRPAIDDEDRRYATAAFHGATSPGVFDFARESPSPFPVGWHVYGPKPKQGSNLAWLDVGIPAGTDQKGRESGLAQIAAVLWHDQPGSFRGVGMDVTETGAATSTAATTRGAAASRAIYRYERDAAELRRIFGPRARDLEAP